jgi:hypothetical protein
MNSWIKKGINAIFLSWIGLSMVLIVCVSLFRINDYITSPRHGIFDNAQEIYNLIFSVENQASQWWFYLYFIVDFIWAVYLLVIIAYFMRFSLQRVIFRLGSIPVSIKKLYFTLAIVVLITEILEALGYVFPDLDFIPLETVVNIKMVLYVFCFSFLMYGMLKNIILPNLKNIIRFLQVSLLSILFIVIIYALVTVMPQGGTIIVDLFYSPWNIVILFYFMTFLALLLSHFPIYVDIWLYGDRDCVNLEMSKRNRTIAGFGIIYFDTHRREHVPQDIYDQKSGIYNNHIIKNLRRSLGVLIYAAVIQIFLDVIPRFFGIHFNTMLITIFLLIVTLIIYSLLGRRYNEWKSVFEGQDEAKKKEVVQGIVSYVSYFPLYFIGCSIMVIITAVLAAVLQWNIITLIFLLITLACQMFLYIYFKISRTYFKYVFYSAKLYARNENMFNKSRLELFKKYGNVDRETISSFLNFFAQLSDNISYLNFMRGSGIVAFIAMLCANIFYGFATWLNPINIILLYIILFYSAIIIVWKHILYYHRKKGDLGLDNFFKYGIPLLLLLIIGWGVYSSGQENDLHELQLVESNEPLDYSEYMQNLTISTLKKKDNYFFVGSYGGGLKANLWNLLLLNRLDTLSDHKFMERTIVMSGVSGGAVGIGNYAALQATHQAEDDLSHDIFTIGKSNVLSNELTYLFGWDWLREYAHFISYKGKDRSYESMKQHAINTGVSLTDYEEKGFLDMWRKLYEKKNKKFPILVMNSTSVAGKQGVVSSIKFPSDTFAGADNLSVFTEKETGGEKSLTYFGAVSTTNRFPLFSPTAKIKGNGNYLDGGYFENSGMLSALEVYDAIERDSLYKEKINPIFINIVNSKDFYIQQKILDWNIEKTSVKESGEIASILETVISIEKLPRFIYEKIKNRGHIIKPILMPHKLSYQNVSAVLKSKVESPLILMDSIKKHNAIIDQALKEYKEYDFEDWGVVEPPLARLLGEPSVRYQEAMIYFHPDVNEALVKILDYIKTDSIVTIKNQDIINTVISKQKVENSVKQYRTKTVKDSIRP